MPCQSWVSCEAQASTNGRLRSSERDVMALTPGAGIWIIDGWVDISQVDLAHEAIDLWNAKHACQKGMCGGRVCERKLK